MRRQINVHFSATTLKNVQVIRGKGGEGHLPEHGLASFTNTSPLFIFFEASFKYSGKIYVVKLEDRCFVAHLALFSFFSLYDFFFLKS